MIQDDALAKGSGLNYFPSLSAYTSASIFTQIHQRRLQETAECCRIAATPFLLSSFLSVTHASLLL